MTYVKPTDTGLPAGVQPSSPTKVRYHNPKDKPPPKGCKLLLLTAGRVPVIGHWTDDCIGWHELLGEPL